VPHPTRCIAVDVGLAFVSLTRTPTSHTRHPLLCLRHARQGLYYARFPERALGGGFARGLNKSWVLPDALGAVLDAHAGELVGLVRQLFRGSHVVVANTAPMVTRLWQGILMREWPAGTNARAALINARLRPLWAQQGWPVVDQATMNVAGYAANATHAYEDHVHFPGALSTAMWYQAMSAVCGEPGGGGGEAGVGSALEATIARKW